MSQDGSTLRRRGTGTFSLGGDYPNYLPIHHEESQHERKNSFHSFLTEKSLQAVEEDHDDVKTDVLYPRYDASKGDHVDMDTFSRLVKDRQRKLSQGTIQLTRTLSRQNQLYGSSKNFEMTHTLPSGPRFTLYSADKNNDMVAQLDEIVNEQGKAALEKMVQSKGWWVDVLLPTIDEMRILSKVNLL